MKKVLIIAEAGVNHNGSLQTAKKLVDVAKDCGADVVKFQTAKLDALVSHYAPMAGYQKENLGEVKSQKEMLREMLLTYDEFNQLAEYCQRKEIEFLSTPFDIDSVEFLNDKVRFWKIPSGEITNYPYLKKIAETGKAIVLSTGMSTLKEIGEALTILRTYGSSDITLLHCTTEYPAPEEEVNLLAMRKMAQEFHTKMGYSDHTAGTEIAFAAVALGATIIEKHFTLDKMMKGPDHKASLEPEELRCLVKGIRKIESAMGNGKKTPTKSEIKNLEVARKSIVALHAIQKGEIFTEENLTTKRPGNGISPMKWNEVLGKTACRDFAEDEMIEL